jgi:uncharacterized protein YjbI with pentapeptide repeats
MPSPGSVITPARAAVAPRVRRTSSADPLPLDTYIRPLLERRQHGTVILHGPPGCGKTTALQHLAATLPADANVRLFDRIKDPAPAPSADQILITSAPDLRGVTDLLCSLELAPWSTDDFIEYLLSTHPDRCRSVMTRVLAAPDAASLGGSPEVWRAVLDAMAADPASPNPTTALREFLRRRLTDVGLYDLTAKTCLAALTASRAKNFAVPPDDFDVPGLTLLRHRPVQLLLAADAIISRLAAGDAWWVLIKPLPRDLIRRTGTLAGNWSEARDCLLSLLKSGKPQCHPMAASLLLAADPMWRPERLKLKRLARAILSAAHWPGVDLYKSDLQCARFMRADLTSARLDSAKLNGTRFRSAVLRSASLRDAWANNADFELADLSSAHLENAQLIRCNMRDTTLVGAMLRGARLTEAVLCRANFRDADLTDAVLHRAKVRGADFTAVNFTRAKLAHTKLRLATLRAATLRAATFRGAVLNACDLEGVSLESPDFSEANLYEAYLTGSSMPGANFTSADLRSTGLADIDWPGAILRDADLRGCSFHLGSCRSGLVGSTIPCEGSRTGFYTDEFNEQGFKPPEEIRKANLTGADLRGANITGVDFYLVDLRRALYTPDQAELLSRTGAILHDRR